MVGHGMGHGGPWHGMGHGGPWHGMGHGMAWATMWGKFLFQFSPSSLFQFSCDSLPGHVK
jgi:hypothetical protein